MLRWSVRLAVMAVVVMSATSVWAQRGGGGRGGFGGGGAIGLLQNEDVRKELEIVDEQVEKLQALQEKLREEMRSQFEGFRDLSEDERRTRFEEMRTKMEERAKEVQKEVDGILLPAQTERLAQIDLQQRLQRQGTVNGLTSGELAEKLGITEEQKAKMEELAKEAEKELQEDMTKARSKARDKILSGLTTEQKEKIKAMLGSEFRMTQPQFGRGGQGGRQGGQAGQGGRQGGRGNRGGDQAQEN